MTRAADSSPRRPFKFPSAKNGQAMVVLAGAMAFIITLAGVSADIANIFTVKNKAQRAADAAAMAGISYYLDHLDEDNVLATANLVSRQVADLNMRKLGLPIKSKSQNINIDNAMYDHGITNMLTINTEAKTVFLQILGAKAKNISVTAVSQSVPAVVSLLLDTSNSMDNTEFLLLKKGAINFIKQFQPKLDRIAIVTFNAYAKVERTMSIFSKHQDLIDIIGEDLATGIQRGDGTNLAHAIERGREEIEKVAGTTAAPKNIIPQKAIKAMVIFSDGAPNVMRGRFMNQLQRSGTPGMPDSGADRRGLTGAWGGEMPMHQITTPASPAPGIDIDAAPAPFEYWYYFYYREPSPFIVTLFTDPNDISSGMIKNGSRLLPCEQPAPYDTWKQYIETNWTCLETFAYKDSRGQLHGEWLKGFMGWEIDGTNKDTVDPDGEGPDPAFSFWHREWHWTWRIWASQGQTVEEVYNSAIYESDYAKDDKITIYIIALGAEAAPYYWCPTTNVWTTDENYRCLDTFKCKDNTIVNSSSNEPCPNEYCQNQDGSFRARKSTNDRCCWDGYSAGQCPTYKCWDGSIVTSVNLCPPRIIYCPDGSVKQSGVDCKVRCPDGTWVNNYSECPVCPDGLPVTSSGTCPQVTCPAPYAHVKVRYYSQCPKGPSE